MPIVRLAACDGMAAVVIVAHAGGVSAQTQLSRPRRTPAAQPPEQDPAATQKPEEPAEVRGDGRRQRVADRGEADQRAGDDDA